MAQISKFAPEGVSLSPLVSYSFCSFKLKIQILYLSHTCWPGCNTRESLQTNLD